MSKKFDDSFYYKLLDYLEEKYYLGAGFHYSDGSDEDNRLEENTGSYTWWIEDRDLGGTFLTLGELVEDVLSKFLNVGSQDSSKSISNYINLE